MAGREPALDLRATIHPASQVSLLPSAQVLGRKHAAVVGREMLVIPTLEKERQENHHFKVFLAVKASLGYMRCCLKQAASLVMMAREETQLLPQPLVWVPFCSSLLSMAMTKH